MYRSSIKGTQYSFHQKIAPVVEIHPYIRSRVLKLDRIPKQLEDMIKNQLMHSMFF